MFTKSIKSIKTYLLICLLGCIIVSCKKLDQVPQDTATGSAVLSDISALLYNYRYEYKKIKQNNQPSFTNDVQLKIYLRYKSPDQVDLAEFFHISEKYESAEWRYVVGTINLQKLKEAGWLKNKDVNILVLE